MVGSETKVKVPILRDTGAVDSFIQAGVLPLFEDSKMGNSIPTQRMDLNVLLVPLHKVMLDCKLFQGRLTCRSCRYRELRSSSAMIGQVPGVG